MKWYLIILGVLIISGIALSIIYLKEPIKKYNMNQTTQQINSLNNSKINQRIPIPIGESDVLIDESLTELKLDTFFPDLQPIENKADITSGYTIFKLNNPFKINLTINDLKFNFSEIKNKITNYQVLINSTNITKEPIYSDVLISKQCINENNSKKYDCSYYEKNLTGYKDIKNEIYIPLVNIPSGVSKIKLIANWKANNKGVQIDWIPTIKTPEDETLISAGLSSLSYIKTDWAWWNSSWSYSVPVTLSTDSGATNANYPISINLSYNAHMNSNFSDIRIVNGTNESSFDYWIEASSNSAYALIWINISNVINATNQTLAYIYYGNSNATSSLSNVTNTFIYGDDFSSNTTTSYTVASNGGTLVPSALQWNSAGYIYHNGTVGGHFNIYSPKANVSGNSTLRRVISRMLNTQSSGVVRPGTGYYNSAGWTSNEFSRILMADASGGAKFAMEQILNNAGTNPYQNYSYTSNKWYTVQMVKWGSSNTYSIFDAYANDSYSNNLTFIGNISYSGITSTPIVTLFSRAVSKQMQWDYLIVAQYFPNNVLSYIGSEMSQANVTDTCTCPGLNTNWNISMNDNCNITSTCLLSSGNLTFYGNGSTLCNATIDTAHMGAPPVNSQLNVGSNCKITGL